MKKLVYLFRNQVESINIRDAILVTFAFALSISLNGQNSPVTTAEKSSDKPAVDVVINESMITRFNAVIYDDEHAGLQHLIKNHNLEEVRLILQTMNVEEISKATAEQLKNLVEDNKSSMKLQMITIKSDQKINTVAVAK
jgi:hypothetical protein